MHHGFRGLSKGERLERYSAGWSGDLRATEFSVPPNFTLKHARIRI
jgi:hypothetical protein